MSEDKQRIEAKTELDKFIKRNFFSQVRESQVVSFLVQQDNALTFANEQIELPFSGKTVTMNHFTKSPK